MASADQEIKFGGPFHTAVTTNNEKDIQNKFEELNKPLQPNHRRLGAHRFNITCEVMRVDLMMKIMDPVEGNISGNDTETSLEYHCVYRDKNGTKNFVLEGLEDESRQQLYNATSDPSVVHYINIPSAHMEFSSSRGANLWLPSTSHSPMMSTGGYQANENNFTTSANVNTSTNATTSSNEYEKQFTVLRGSRRFYEPTPINGPTQTTGKNVGHSIPQGAPNPRTHGKKSTLVIRISTTDQIFPVSADKLSQSVFGGPKDNLNAASQFRSCSHGKMELEMAEGHGVQDGVLDISLNHFARNSKASYIANEASTAAEAALGISLEGNFDFVMYCIPPGTVSSGKKNWFAFAYMNWFKSIYNGLACTYVSAQMHEIGHNIGLVHSGKGNDKYGDTSGYMGYGFSSSEFPRMCFNPAKSWALEWYQDRHTVVNPANGQWVGRIMGVDDYDSYDHSVVVRVSTGLESDIFVGYNNQKGINSETGQFGNQVTVVTEHKILAALEVRQSFFVPETNIVIHVCDKSAPGATDGLGDWMLVSIRMGKESLSCVPVISTVGPQAENDSPTTTVPTRKPTLFPTSHPTPSPTFQPTPHPSVQPILGNPTPRMRNPTFQPTLNPTSRPTSRRTTQNPTLRRIPSPTFDPSSTPTSQPVSAPSASPTPQLQFPFNLDPIAAYSFDGNAADITGNGLTGKIQGNTIYEKEGDDYSMVLSQIHEHQYVVIGPYDKLRYEANQDFTISFWTKAAPAGAMSGRDDPAIISNKDWEAASNKGWAISRTKSGHLQLNIADGINNVVYPTTSSLGDYAWHHIALTLSRISFTPFAKLFFDGVKIANIDISKIGDLSSGLPTVIGTDGKFGAKYPAWYDGNIDGLLIYDSAVDEIDVRALYTSGRSPLPKESQLIAEYNFEGDLKNMAQQGQSSRYQVAASTSGEPQFEEDDQGKFITLSQTTSNRQFVSLASSPLLGFGADVDFSISIWVMTDFDFRSDPSMYHDPALITNKSWDAVKNKGWMIAATPGGGFQWNMADGSKVAEFASNNRILNDGHWHHILISHRRASFANIYFDGVHLEKISISNIGDVNSGMSIVVGTDATHGANWPAWFNGSIDKILLYRGALSPSVVKSMYEDGRKL